MWNEGAKVGIKSGIRHSRIIFLLRAIRPAVGTRKRPERRSEDATGLLSGRESDLNAGEYEKRRLAAPVNVSMLYLPA